MLEHSQKLPPTLSLMLLESPLLEGSHQGNYTRMIERMEGHWWQFKASKPGRRFQDRYRWRQRDRGSSLRRISSIVVGLVIAIASVFLGWAPGPGISTFLIGLWLVAGEPVPSPSVWTVPR